MGDWINKKGERICSPFLFSRERADWLETILSNYRDSKRGLLLLSDFRLKVLHNTPLLESTFSFTHAIFRIHNILQLPTNFRTSPFSSQLELDSLFGLCRTAEEWLKYAQTPSNSNERQIGGQILRLLNSQHLSWAPADLKNINGLAKNYFDQCVQNLLNGSSGYFHRDFQSLESDLIVIYLFRNRAGHGSISSKIVWENFDKLVERVLFGLFSICERLY